MTGHLKRFLIPAMIAVLLTGCGVRDELISQAMAKVEEGDLDGAGELLDQARDTGEDGQLLERSLGILSMERGDYVEAIKHFEQSIAQANGHVTELEFDTNFYLMSAQQKAGLVADAIETCSAIIGLRPTDSELYFTRGELNLEKGSYDEAIRDFNKAVDNCGNNPDMYIRIFEYLDGKGFDEAAQSYLDDAQSLDGRFTDYQKGRLAFCKKDYELARDYLEKARLSEEEGVILYLGKTYEALGDMSFAASLYSTYVEKHPEDAKVLNQLGLCRLDMGESDKALEAFDQGLETGSVAMRQSLLFNKATALERMGELQEAKKLIKDYVEEFPADPDGKREKDFLTQWDRFGDNH